MSRCFHNRVLCQLRLRDSDNSCRFRYLRSYNHFQFRLWSCHPRLPHRSYRFRLPRIPYRLLHMHGSYHSRLPHKTSHSGRTPASYHIRSCCRFHCFRVLCCTVSRSLHPSTRFRPQTRWIPPDIFRHCNNTHPRSWHCLSRSTGYAGHPRFVPCTHPPDGFLPRTRSYHPFRMSRCFHNRVLCRFRPHN